VTGLEGNPGDGHLPGPGEAWTPIRLTRWSGEYLGGKGVENGRLDAELLLAHVLNTSRLDLYLQFDRPLKPEELSAFKALLRRRVAREPLQYILGRTAFRELNLRTDPRALIPRQETEVLVGEVLDWASRRGKPLTALDVGTGSGAIALSLLKEGRFQRAVGTDPSSEALDLARENAIDHGLAEKLDLREGPGFEPLGVGERFDVIVSNPPYVSDACESSLQPEIRDWEPASALFAGKDGMDVLLDLIEGVAPFLEPGGLFATEIGDGQGPDVARAMEGTGTFHLVSIRPDLAGRDRVVLGVAGA